ncbi:hypothetical protein RHMOL_Rhmol05G0067900 [Rhododendron molle]|uniref:Uncharacterized protein n=1 Tax=Rhododendron molle TaxID=49168 RepID=A0ACC0NM37_RHOML|nr:hypothetical protein RHMOL_Rhmol05G0067900 [Rhododendron molle]
MDLPKFVVFNSLSNKNYLCPGGTHGYMKFEAMDVVRWGVKHEVQKAKTGGGLIHIRCCDTGKYWTWGLSKDSVQFITAQADQPGEDTTTRACTLIKPCHNTKDGVKVINLEVMYVGEWWPIGGNKGGYLVSGDEDFIISNWESLPANQPQEPSIGDKNMDTECAGATLGSEEMDLPKFVSFNSISNKNYLRPDGINSYIKFGAVDVISWGVKHEVQKAKSGGGLVHIRCCDTGKYWSWGLTDYSKSFIVSQANQPGEDTTTGACTLIKPSQYTKDGVSVVNFQVMYEGTWWSIGGDNEGYLVIGGEDFIVSDWELLPHIGNEEMDLPKFVVFNSLSNKNYLRPGGINSYMKFEVVEVVKWGVKHEVQKAKYGDGLVHIRCCDTSKYWSWGLTTDSVNFITAQADQPGEDTTTRACTLIKPSHNTKDGVKVVNLQVMYQGKWLSVGRNEGGYLVAGDEDFIVPNWETLPPNQLQGLGNKNINTGGTGASIGSEKMAFQKFKEEMDLPKFEEEVDLPKFVVFNSLLNKNYLRPEGANSYMKFEVVDAISWGVKHEVMKKKSGGGLVHIRCCDTGKYWSWGLTDYSRSYIVAQADHPVEDTTTRACTLIKPSQYTKDGVSVVNLQVMHKGTWWSIGGDGGGYLVTGGEDFIISDWELLPRNQLKGPSVGDKNMYTGGTSASTGNEEMDLPKFEDEMRLTKIVVFNSLLNTNYLRPVGQNCYMKFDQTADLGSWGVKHEIQMSKSGGGLVHIRCCDNGKYWAWGPTKDSVDFITAQANQPGEDTSTRVCTLIKPSFNTKDGVSAINLEVMYQGTWWPIGGDSRGYLKVGGEDFIVSDWESLPPKQPQGASDGDKNTNTGGGVLIGDTTMEGGVSFGSSNNIGAPVSIGNTTVNYQLLATQIPQEVVHQLGTQLSEMVDQLFVNMNTGGFRGAEAWLATAQRCESSGRGSEQNVGCKVDKLIGKGGCNCLYKGILPDGKPVAVKVSKSSKESWKDFTQVVDVLIGVCVEDNALISVYDLLPKGNLEENLHVAIGIAEALNYLHNESSPPVIHRDFKSSNILLLDEFEPKLSDFGLAIWGPSDSSFLTDNDVVVTFWYLAPEYFMYGKGSDKINAYSFGVVVLELLSGRKPISSESTKGQERLVMWAKLKLESGDLRSILDPNLDGNIDEVQIQRMALAVRFCLIRSARLHPKTRQFRGRGLRRHSAIFLLVWPWWLDGTQFLGVFLFYENCEMRLLVESTESHMTLALLDTEDTSTSFSSGEPSSGTSSEEYLKGRWNRSSSLD